MVCWILDANDQKKLKDEKKMNLKETYKETIIVIILGQSIKKVGSSIPKKNTVIYTSSVRREGVEGGFTPL